MAPLRSIASAAVAVPRDTVAAFSIASCSAPTALLAVVLSGRRAVRALALRTLAARGALLFEWWQAENAELNSNWRRRASLDSACRSDRRSLAR